MMRIKTPMFNNPEFAAKVVEISNYLYIAAAVVTVLATLGAVYFGKVTANFKDSQLKQYQKGADVSIAASNLKAAEAYQKGEEAQAGAAGANAVAATAKAQSDVARADAEKAKADAAAANAEAEKSKTERAVLQVKIEELMSANLSLNQQVSVLRENDRPRIVSPEQKNTISRSLRAFSGASVTVAIYSQESEAAHFAGQIGEALGAAGMKVEFANMIGQSGVGLGFLFHTEADRFSPLAKAIAGAFQTVGFSFGVQVSGGPAGFEILVGAKPKIAQ
jgi:hypothetical protein